MSSVEQLIRKLKSDGEVKAEGEFTLDPDKAREKMRQFQLQDPHQYILLLVQAAVLKKTARVDIKVSARNMRMTFSGEHFTRKELEELFMSLFTRKQDARLAARRELALGVNAGMAFDPKFLTVTSGDGEKAHTLTLRPGADDQVERAARAVAGTRIEMKERLKASHAFEALRAVFNPLKEEELVKSKCRYAMIKVFLNGKQVSAGPRHTASMSHESNNRTYTFNLEAGFDKAYIHSRVIFVMHGVVVSSRHVKSFVNGFRAVISGSDFSKDVSHMGIVEDDAYAAAIHVVQDAYEGCLKDLCDPWLLGGEQDVVALQKDIWRLQVVKNAFIANASLSRIKKHKGSFAYLAASLKIWRSATSDAIFYSIHELIKQAVDQDGEVYISKRSFQDLVYKDDLKVVYLIEDEEREFFHRLFKNNIKNVTRHLQTRAKQDLKRKAWLARPMDPELSRGFYAVRRVISSKCVKGEMGLRPSGSNDTSLSLIVGGHLVCTTSQIYPLPGLDIVVESDFKVNSNYDGVHRNNAFVDCLIEVLGLVNPLMNDLLEHIMSPSRFYRMYASEVRIIKIWLERSLDPGYASRALEGFGVSASAVRKGLERNGKKKNYATPIIGLKSYTHAEPGNAEGRVDCSKVLDVHLFKTVSHGSVSLNDISEEISRTKKIRYVKGEGSWSQQYFILILDALDMKLFKLLMGPGILTDHEKLQATELAERRHMFKPVQALALSRRSLSEYSFEVGGLSGVLGIPAVDSNSGRKVRQGIARIKVLYHNRRLEELSFTIPTGMVVGVVNSDTVELNTTWERLRSHSRKKLERTVKLHIPRMFIKLAEELQGMSDAEQDYARYHLRNAYGVYNKKTKPAAVKEFNDTFEALPFFNDLTGRQLSLADLFLLQRNNEKIPWVKQVYVKDYKGPQISGVLVIGPGDQNFLESLFGHSELENQEGELTRKRLESRFNERPPLAEIRLSEAEVLIDMEINEGKVYGRVGLSEQHRYGENEAVLSLCKNMRELGAIRWASTYPLVAKLNDDRLELTHEYPGFIMDASVKATQRLCLSKVPELVEALADQFDALTDMPIQRTAAIRFFLDYVAENAPRTKGDDSRIGDPLAGRLAGLKILQGADGQFYSVIDLGRTYAAYKNVFYLNFFVSGEFPKPDQIVVVLDHYAQKCLRKIFPEMKFLGWEWERLQSQMQYFKDAEPLPLMNGSSLMHHMDIKGHELKGWIGVSLSADTDTKVTLGYNGFQISQQVVSDIFPVSGVLEVAALPNDWPWSSYILPKRLAHTLTRRVITLYAELGALFSSNFHSSDKMDERMEKARAVLKHVMMQLHHHRQDGEERKTIQKFNALYDQLKTLRLLDTVDGDTLSLEDGLLMDAPPAEIRALELDRGWRQKLERQERPPRGSRLSERRGFKRVVKQESSKSSKRKGSKPTQARKKTKAPKRFA